MSDTEDDRSADADEEELEQDVDEEAVPEYDVLNEPTKISTFCDIIVIAPENHKTSNMITKTEMTEIISIRATQISTRFNAMVDTKGFDDPIKIAKYEFNMRRCPLMLRRCVKKEYDKKKGIQIKYVEDKNVNDMERPFTYQI
jgi:DNA-directed RNA polymerase subunit K/omega